MIKSLEIRIETLERGDLSGPGGSDFVAALQDARQRAATGEPIPEVPVTAEMLEDPVHGEFFRRLLEARERVGTHGVISETCRIPSAAL